MIIGISGKKQSGKDISGKIIQYITDKYRAGYQHPHTDIDFKEYYKNHQDRYSQWKIVKFADKVKDIVCIILGCTREQLESEEFKNTPLGEEWIRYGYADGFSHIYDDGKKVHTIMNNKQCDKERYELELKTNWQTAYKTELTPRLLLTGIGTDVCRAIHSNMWVNATMRDYKLVSSQITIIDHANPSINAYMADEPIVTQYPNWIITDVRFPNEAKAVTSRDGLLVRINSRYIDYENQITRVDFENEHESEVALDNAEFDEVINNDGSLEDLIFKWDKILTKYNIL